VRFGTDWLRYHRHHGGVPRFYFDVDENTRATHDMDGDELADREAARQEALLILAQAAGSLQARKAGTEITELHPVSLDTHLSEERPER
jgi:uncharacterized protein DUF6894